MGRDEAWNMRLVGHSYLDGHGDGMHVNLKDGYAFVGHMGESRVGTSIVDVKDPTKPEVVGRLETSEGTHSHKVQIVGDILLVNQERNDRREPAPVWEAGLKVYDVSEPTRPQLLSFFETPGIGVHRMTYWEAPYAYMSASGHGIDHQFLMIVDLSDPATPQEVGRWWLPGMNRGAGETPSWPPNKRVWLHHALTRGNRAYCGWWDAGLVILDITDLSSPKLVSHLDFGAEVSMETHTALPVPDRDLLIVTDETLLDGGKGVPKQVRVVSIEDEERPSVISTFPVPEGDFLSRGGRFGPHNVHEMRPGSLQSSETIYLTYFNAGVRVVDIADAAHPQEIAYFVPASSPDRPTVQLNDLIVDADGLVYVTDRFGSGLYILEATI